MAETPESPYKPETWTCAGARVGTGGKRLIGWLPPEITPSADGDPDAGVYFYASRAPQITGGRYELRVRRDGPKPVISNLPPVYTGKRMDYADPVLLAWRAMEIAAEADLAARARERKHKGQDPIDKAIEPLMEIAAGLRTSGERDAFIASVTRRLNGAWRTR